MIVRVDVAVLGSKIDVHQQIGQGRAGHLDSLTDEHIAFADGLFTRAAEVNHEQTVRLRSRGG